MIQHAAGKKDYRVKGKCPHHPSLQPQGPLPVGIYCFLFVYSIYIIFTHTQEHLLKHTIFVLFHAF